MKLTQQIAKHFREVYFGGNWTSVDLKTTLADVSWQHATTKVYTFNTIAALVYHISYYVSAITDVLQGAPLTAKDNFSFTHPPVQCHEDWEAVLHKTWADAELFALLVEQYPEEKLEATFVEEKYGSYLRNLLGVIEHTHYHLGQIVLIKKILLQKA